MTEEIGRELGGIRKRLLEIAGMLHDESTEEPDAPSAKKIKWAASILKGLAVND